MAALTPDQLELLQRAREGVPQWGGSTAIPRLRGDVELLLALGLIEAHGDAPYTLTPLGARALDTASPRPPGAGQ